MRKLLLALLLAPLAAWLPSAARASEGGYRLDRAPIDPKDLVSLQAGARTFVNYCLNCHGAQYMRYNRLGDHGLSESQIRDNLLFTDAKVGETMKVALAAKDGKAMFGAAPPDLSVIGRSRGADWLYTYLRTFYRDDNSPTGWNNAVFPQVAMPHALWTLQGERKLELLEDKEHHGAPE
ncbi:MAG TPA: cytochrome c1, partial [Burkholderiaceae bacterium]